MKKLFFGIALLALAIAVPIPAMAGVNVNINIPLPPLVFPAPPDVIVIPDSGDVYGEEKQDGK